MNTTPTKSRRPPVPPHGVAISGIVFSLMYFVTLFLVRLSVPADPGDPGVWLTDPTRRYWVSIALNLVPFSGIAFLWFMAVLRNHIGTLEDKFFSTVFLGSGLLHVAMLFCSAAAARVLIDTFSAEIPFQTETYHFGRGIVYTLMTTFGMRMAAVFMFVTSTIGLRTGIFARWVSLAGFTGGVVLLLFITTTAWVALLFPAWALLVSTYILIANERSSQ